jgi:hypothetical protein
MTVPSVKVTLDKEYELRFEQDDVIACEDEMKMGYVFFFRVERLNGILVPTVLSLRLLRTLVHHGLKLRDNRGDFIYALPQSAEGQKMAGDLIQQFKQAGGHDIDLWEKCRLAFADWFATPKEGEVPRQEPMSEAKNAPGAG